MQIYILNSINNELCFPKKTVRYAFLRNAAQTLTHPTGLTRCLDLSCSPALPLPYSPTPYSLLPTP